MLSHPIIFVGLNKPGLGSMLASNSRWDLSWLRLAGSPVLCSAMVSSCTLWANDAGVCSWKTNGHILFIHYWNITRLVAFERVNSQAVQTDGCYTLSMMDCMWDLCDWSPYSREDHWSGAMRRPPSIAIWTIWESCSRRSASYVRNSSFNCISEESSSRLVTYDTEDA